jgi:hypothetical protein
MKNTEAKQNQKSTIAFRAMWVFILLSFLPFVFAAGCGEGKRKEIKSAASGTEPLKPEEILKDPQKVSAQVLGTTPKKGLLGEVLKRGYIKIALPPSEQPFQYIHTELNNRPTGFNVALAEKIALALNVKAEISISSPGKEEGFSCRGGPCDITFHSPRAGKCENGGEIKYFYEGTTRQWRTICVPGGDQYLKEAVENVLSFFAETGIFADLYSTYFD